LASVVLGTAQDRDAKPLGAGQAIVLALRGRRE
jgi:hypothetical protein